MNILLKLILSFAVFATTTNAKVVPTKLPTMEPTMDSTDNQVETTEPTVEPTKMPTMFPTLKTLSPTIATTIPSVVEVKVTLAPIVDDIPKTVSPSNAEVKTSAPSTKLDIVTDSPTVMSTILDATTSSPTSQPIEDLTTTTTPTAVVVSNPVKLPYALCPVFQGKQVQCSGCQYCPDGSICPDCVSANVANTPVPSILATSMPTVAPSPQTPSDYQLCPVFNGQQVQCNGCQFCPDGSRCKNCNLTTIVPTVAPTVPPTDKPVTPPTTRPPYELCPANNGLVVRCSGCQYCPDGSLCSNCVK